MIYSPGGSGWEFYPEELLFVGITGTIEAMTIVRSYLVFVLPELSREDILTKAVLHLYLVRNEPPETPKILCLREAPGSGAWSLEEEEAWPIFRVEHFGTPTGMVVDFDLTGQVDSWRQGGPPQGILLGFAERIPGLLAFANPADGPGKPVLSLTCVRRVGDGEIAEMSLDPDGIMESEEFPRGGVLVENQGPGLVWITPLYRFERWRPITPDNTRTETVRPGERLVLEPIWDARAFSYRAVASNAPARVQVCRLAEERGEA